VDSQETVHTAAGVPAALAEPVRARWITLLFLANVGLWLAIYAPIQVVLPEQVQSLHPADKAVLFSVVMAAGAIASLLANPVVGALSDRTTSRLVILAAAPDIPVMVLGWCVTQAGLGGMLATLTSAGRPHRHQPDAGHRPGRPDRHRRRDQAVGRLPDLRSAGDRGCARVHVADPG
jgi:hypothetical protein